MLKRPQSAVLIGFFIATIAQAEPQDLPAEPRLEPATEQLSTPPRRRTARQRREPLIGVREKLVLGLLRQVVPAEHRETYDDASQIIEHVANIVDRVRPVPQPVPAPPASFGDPGLQLGDPGELGSAGPMLDRPIRVPELAEADPAAGPNEAVMGRLRELQSSLKRQLRERHEELERDRAETRERLEREHEKRRELERRKREELHRDPRGHENPFRGGPGPSHGPHLPDRHGHGPHDDHDHAHDDHEHDDHHHDDHPHNDHPHADHHEARPMERMAHEIEVLRLDVERLETLVERSELRAETAAEADRVSIWAIERVIELYGPEAPEVLTELLPEVNSRQVQRFLVMRLAELAGHDRDAALGPLKSLIIDNVKSIED